MQLKIEQAALLREAENPANKNGWKLLKNSWKHWAMNPASLLKKWEAVKRQMAEIAALQQKIEDCRYNLEVSQRRGDLEKAAELTYAILPGLMSDLKRPRLNYPALTR